MESQQTEKVADWCPKDPSELEFKAYFTLKGEEVWLVVADFLVPARPQRGCDNPLFF